MFSGQDWTLDALTGELRELSFSRIFYTVVFDISVFKGFRSV